MKRIITLAVAIAALGAAATADAKPCNLACLTKQVKTLTKQVKTLSKEVQSDTTSIGVLQDCVQEVGVTSYGDGETGTFGYSYNPGDGTAPYLTSAMDATNPGDPVDAWMLVDGCNTKITASESSTMPQRFNLTKLFNYPASSDAIFGFRRSHRR